MQGLVDEALVEGYLGLSIDMLPWHRLDGEPFRGISVPSQHAPASEYRSLAQVVRPSRSHFASDTQRAHEKHGCRSRNAQHRSRSQAAAHHDRAAMT